MSRSNYDKPFYVDVGTSIVAIRCASNHDVVAEYDHAWSKGTIKLAEDICDRMNEEAGILNSGDCAKLRETMLAIKAGILKRREENAWYISDSDILEKIDAALAARPRNCDMPLVVDGPADNSADKAWLVFKRHNPDAYFDVPGLLRCIDWLLAPATEQKGQENG